jgi:hypothetical protein
MFDRQILRAMSPALERAGTRSASAGGRPGVVHARLVPGESENALNPLPSDDDGNAIP